MKIISEITLEEFNPWSGAVETWQRIFAENKASEFESQIEELYPNGLTDTELNDLLWFDSESVFEWLGITDEEESEDKQEEV